MVSVESITKHICHIHGLKVMTDRDLAELYGVETKQLKLGLRYPPMAFTEQGVAMLSTVLNSKRAIQVNIQISD